jgi:2-polyprenyl-3-methyl-5-hydroxy-6-metoxy-1,4-benzoquinol methylase
MSVQSYFEANRSEVASMLPLTYSKVLEVGCATGRFAAHLKLPCETWGIEPNGLAAEAARNNLGRVFTGTYDDVEMHLPDRYFDLVICNDVIEHMVDHDLFLEQIKKKMTDGGIIVGSVPNVRHVTALIKLLIAKDWPYSDSGILDRTHLRFFTEKSLRRCFEHHGFEIQLFKGLGSVIQNGLYRPSSPLSTPLNAAFRLSCLLVVILTLGTYWDTQYPQFGFQVRMA